MHNRSRMHGLRTVQRNIDSARAGVQTTRRHHVSSTALTSRPDDRYCYPSCKKDVPHAVSQSELLAREHDGKFSRHQDGKAGRVNGNAAFNDDLPPALLVFGLHGSLVLWF